MDPHKYCEQFALFKKLHETKVKSSQQLLPFSLKMKTQVDKPYQPVAQSLSYVALHQPTCSMYTSTSFEREDHKMPNRRTLRY